MTGHESDLAYYFPTPFLGNFYYAAEDFSANSYCGSTSADSYWDVCSNRTQMVFNYTLCSEKVAYSSGLTRRYAQIL